MRAFAPQVSLAAARSSPSPRPKQTAEPPVQSADRTPFSFDNVRVFPRREVPLSLPRPERRRLTEGTPPEAIALLGSGRPLTAAESALAPAGRDALGDVRVHDDLAALLTAGVLGDAGYAFGRDVVLGDAAPSAARDRLLAHELVHVLQHLAPPERALSPDAEREAEELSQQGALEEMPGRAARAFAERVIARYTHNLPNNLMLIVDVDDGDFVGGCVRAIVPHLGVKLILRGVPRAAGNQLFNLHLGVFTNPAGESCFFFYESVSGACDVFCAPTLEQLKRKLREIRDWLKEKIESLLRGLLPVAIAAAIAYVIADLLVAALAAAGILAVA